MNDNYEEVEVSLSMNEIATLALEAHDNRITLNQHINNKLKSFIDVEELPEDNLLKMSNLKKDADELGMECVDLLNTTKDENAFEVLGYNYCLGNMVVPFRFEDDESLTIATIGILTKKDQCYMERASNRKINILLADENDILKALSDFAGPIH